MIYQKASRLKLRFPSGKGELMVEDLWDLPLSSGVNVKTTLDSIAKDVNRKLKEVAEESFVVTNTKTDSILQLQLDILKDIIAIKMAEAAIATSARENAEKKQLILGLISQKKQGQLAEMSVEDLEKMAAGL